MLAKEKKGILSSRQFEYPSVSRCLWQPPARVVVVCLRALNVSFTVEDTKTAFRMSPCDRDKCPHVSPSDVNRRGVSLSCAAVKFLPGLWIILLPPSIRRVNNLPPHLCRSEMKWKCDHQKWYKQVVVDGREGVKSPFPRMTRLLMWLCSGSRLAE